MGDKLGIYIHIPFCRSKCDYCDFYSLSGREGRMDHYQKALLAHLRETAPLTQGIPVDSVYFGGGTPSFYGAKRLKELLATLHKLFQIEKDAEITVECNPDSVDLRALCTLRKAGVNRLSLGMQSAQAEELAAAKQRMTELEDQLFSLRAQALTDRGDLLLLEPPTRPDGARKLADAAAKASGGLAAVFAGAESSYVYALVQADRADISPLVKRLNAALSGRGGGRNGFAQGSVQADRHL